MEEKISEENPELGTITLSEDLDGDSLPKLQEAIKGMIDKGVLQIILDFSDMHFISSLGIGTIVNLGEKLKEKDGSIIVVCQTPRIMAEFKQMHLDEVINIFEMMDEALAALR